MNYDDIMNLAETYAEAYASASADYANAEEQQVAWEQSGAARNRLASAVAELTTRADNENQTS